MSETTSRTVTSEASDESLMARYADGEVEAFDELFRRYEARVYAFFVRRTGSAEQARDLYQELFLRIHRARDAYDPERPFAPWLFQIAHRLVLDDWRRADRAHEVPLLDREIAAGLPDEEQRAGDRERLGQALGALSPDERYVLVSSRVEGVPLRKLAADLGKSVDAVKKMASRATQRLRADRDAVLPVGMPTS